MVLPRLRSTSPLKISITLYIHFILVSEAHAQVLSENLSLRDEFPRWKDRSGEVGECGISSF